MDCLPIFFNQLAVRFSKENDLSDVTWAMCQASPCFKKLWLTFFFPDLDVEQVIGIERESPDDVGEGSRADFVITVDQETKPYVIEIKIGDRCHHFGQYESAYGIGKERFGYITNYPLHQEGYEVKQWRFFYQYLLGITEVPDEEKKLLDGYCEYLKNVCGIVMMDRKIDLNRLASLYDLTVVLHELVGISAGQYETKRYRDFAKDYAKYICFSLKYKDLFPQEKIYPIVGIWFNSPGPRLCAGYFNDAGWGKTVCGFLRQHRHCFSKVENEWSNGPMDKEGYFFYLSDSALQQFNSADNVESQKEILSNFIKEVIEYPLKINELIK